MARPIILASPPTPLAYRRRALGIQKYWWLVGPIHRRASP
jgi:hypothetical protein